VLKNTAEEFFKQKKYLNSLTKRGIAMQVARKRNFDTPSFNT